MHWRALAGAIGDWPALYREAYKHVKPGGWIEAQEHEDSVCSDDDTLEKAGEIVKWLNLVREASIRFGKRTDAAKKQKQYMIDAGFVDVHDDIYKVFPFDFST